MSNIYFTITGTKYYFGTEFMKPEMEVKLVKEPDNEYDSEAILVKMEGLGDVGHVANSPYTALGESMSAGRLYDKIADEAIGEIVYILPQGVLCKLRQESDFRQDGVYEAGRSGLEQKKDKEVSECDL